TMIRTAITVVFLAAFISACSKKDQAAAPAAAAAPSSSDAAAANPNPPPAADTAAAQPPPGPVLDTSQMTGDAKQAIADADAALRQKEYEKAVRTMLAIQQAQLNAQQAAAARQAMIALQRNISAAAASGDQRAIAAGEALRAASRH